MCIRDDICICHSSKYLSVFANSSAVKIWLNVFACLTENFILIAFSATGKVLALELPKNGNDKCSVLYPASAKASTDIGVCDIVPSLYVSTCPHSPINLVSYRNLFFHVFSPRFFWFCSICGGFFFLLSTIVQKKVKKERTRETANHKSHSSFPFFLA